MTNLALLLGGLFVALFILVKLTERFAKPIDNQQMEKLSSVLIILLVIMVALSVLKYLIGF